MVTQLDEKSNGKLDTSIAEVRAENQDEIEKIMNEIEELQKGLNSATFTQPKPSPSLVSEPLEETLSEIAPEQPSHQGGVFGGDSSADLAVSTEEGSVSMTIGGKMCLNVKYETSGKDFTLRFTEETIQVILSDGTEFQILIPHKNNKTSSN